MNRKERLVYEIQRYIFDETTFDEFKDWFVPWSWNPSKSIASTVGTVDCRISEYTKKNITENELKQLLQKEIEDV